jgi:hypothetical protein
MKNKLIIIAVFPFLLTGCWWQHKTSSTPAQGPQQGSSAAQPMNPNIDLGVGKDAVKQIAADANGLTYTNKEYQFSLWYPSNMTVAEAREKKRTTVTIVPKVASLNMTITVIAEQDPQTGFNDLPGDPLFMHNVLAKRLPVDEKDTNKTNVYVFQKQNTRVTVKLAPGTSDERFTFPDIVQSFTFL